MVAAIARALIDFRAERSHNAMVSPVPPQLGLPSLLFVQPSEGHPLHADADHLPLGSAFQFIDGVLPTTGASGPFGGGIGGGGTGGSTGSQSQQSQSQVFGQVLQRPMLERWSDDAPQSAPGAKAAAVQGDANEMISLDDEQEALGFQAQDDARVTDGASDSESAPRPKRLFGSAGPSAGPRHDRVDYLDLDQPTANVLSSAGAFGPQAPVTALGLKRTREQSSPSKSAVPGEQPMADRDACSLGGTLTPAQSRRALRLPGKYAGVGDDDFEQPPPNATAAAALCPLAPLGASSCQPAAQAMASSQPAGAKGGGNNRCRQPPETLERVHELCREGRSLRGIRNKLNEEGFKNSKGQVWPINNDHAVVIRIITKKGYTVPPLDTDDGEDEDEGVGDEAAAVTPASLIAFKLKLENGEKCLLDRSLSFDALVDEARKALYPGLPPTEQPLVRRFTFVDHEGDMIAIMNDMQLKSAVRIVKAPHSTLVRRAPSESKLY